jgi:hypothetical protein
LRPSTELSGSSSLPGEIEPVIEDFCTDASASRGAAFSPNIPSTALPMMREPAIPATQVVSSQR